MDVSSWRTRFRIVNCRAKESTILTGQWTQTSITIGERKTFIGGRLVVTEREAQAKDTVKKYMYWSMAAGLIPVPAFDLAAIFAIQLKMVCALAKQYDLPFSEDRGKALIASLVGGAAPAAAAPAVASAIKTIPLIGTTVGAITSPALAGASTYAVGKVFIQHFESGGTFLDFNPEKVRDYYAENYDKARKKA